MNPCVCGYRGDPVRACRCTPLQISRYHGRLSGPLRDRLDITVPVAPVPAGTLTGPRNGESSRAVRARVLEARPATGPAYQGLPCRRTPACAPATGGVCALGPDERRLLERAVTRLGLSARAYDRVRRVARTIADLEAPQSSARPISRRRWGIGTSGADMRGRRMVIFWESPCSVHRSCPVRAIPLP